jgi:hypothetical protein
MRTEHRPLSIDDCNLEDQAVDKEIEILRRLHLYINTLIFQSKYTTDSVIIAALRALDRRKDKLSSNTVYSDEHAYYMAFAIRDSLSKYIAFKNRPRFTFFIGIEKIALLASIVKDNPSKIPEFIEMMKQCPEHILLDLAQYYEHSRFTPINNNLYSLG